jgi:hypothetical protein
VPLSSSGKLTWTDLEPNRDLRSNRPATYSLKHGAAINYEIRLCIVKEIEFVPKSEHIARQFYEDKPVNFAIWCKRFLF